MKKVLAAVVLLCCAAAFFAVRRSPPENDGDAPSAEDTLTIEEIRTAAFADVSPSSDAADCISYTVHQDILSGIDSDCFRPDDWTALGTVLTALRNIDPAYEDSVTGGQDERELVTRARLAELLYWFADGGDSGDAALVWAQENGLYACMGSEHPGLPVTRAQLAQVLTALTAYRTGESVAEELTARMKCEEVSSRQSVRDEIQRLVDTTAEKYGAAGLQAAVVENGRVTGSYTFGWATKDSDPMTAEHKIRSASLSKVVVGITAMLLREEGKISLDDDISGYWGFAIRNPAYPGTPITIRSLLNHTSSIYLFDDTVPRKNSDVRTQLSGPSGFSANPPGEYRSWGYNNYAFAVLGMTLELASGKYLDTILEKYLWNIMEIEASFDSGCLENSELLTTIYRSDGTVGLSTQRQEQFMHASSPGQAGGSFAGGLTISAADLAKITALLSSGGYYEGLRLLDAESVELMEERMEPRLPDGTWQALPLRSQDDLYRRARIFYHTGSAYGVYNLLSYDPDTGDGVVVLTTGADNTEDSRGIYAVCSEISGGIYRLLESEKQQDIKKDAVP